MSGNNKKSSSFHDLDEINLQDEDASLSSFELNTNNLNNSKVNVALHWQNIMNKYLNSVQYAFEKGNFTTKKVSGVINKIPEPNMRRIIQITLILLFFALVIFLASCQTNNPYRAPVSSAPLPNKQSQPVVSYSGINKNRINNKGKEQLYIKREKLNIRQKESGSTSGSIWADSSSPKSLLTEFKPAKPGDMVTVNIPEDLQYKQDPPAQGAAAEQKIEPVKSFKFEVVGIEPGGDVFLRGTKNYTSDKGEQRNLIVLAKVPRRNINNSEINAKELTEVAVNENFNGAESDYSSTGWDKIVSRKVAGYVPDLSAQTAAMSAEKKEIDTQKKALADQKKSLDSEAERLKKDRTRLDTQTEKAKSILEAATIVGDGSGQPAGAKNSAKTPNAAPPQSNKPAAPANNAEAKKP